MSNQFSIAAMAIMVWAPLVAMAFSPPSALQVRDVTLRRPSSSKALYYLNYDHNYHSSYYEYLDVDGDRMSLLSLLDPAAIAATKKDETTKESTPSTPEVTQKSSPRNSKKAMTAQRSSPVTQLHSIQDYHRLVLSNPNQLCVIRFSAPWCKVCQSTNVAWERMASKICKMNQQESNDDDNANINNSKMIKFLSVSVDGRDAATTALKDMLSVQRVPQGILHHPAQGVFGRKVDLNRSSLSTLKKQLETYVGDNGMNSIMLLNGLHP